MLAKTIKKAAMIDVFRSKLCLLYIHYFVSIVNAQHYILRHCLPYYPECNQNCVKGVSLSASMNSPKNDARQKMAIIFYVRFDNDTIFQLWLHNFNLKPLSRNHPCYSTSCPTTLDVPRGIDNKSTLWKFLLGFHLILSYVRVLSLFLDKHIFYFCQLCSKG